MSRLLVLCHFFPPLAGGGVYRPLSFTRWLPAQGWDCTVVCAGPRDYWVRDESLLAAIPAGTEVIRVPGGSGLSAVLGLGRGSDPVTSGRRSGTLFSTLRRLSTWTLVPDSYVGWAARARRAAAARLARGGISAILSTSPPDSVHLAALPLARRFGLPWVADFRDPWIHLHRLPPPTAWHASRQRTLERRVLAAADLVVVATRTHERDLLADAGAPARRVVRIENGYEPEPAPAGETPPLDRERFTLVFTGTLTLTPDIETLLEALHELFARRPEARRRIRVRLAGPYETGYADRAIALGLQGIVEFLGPVPHARARELQRAADLLILWKPPGCGAAVPAKLFEYLDAARPVLALLEDEDEAGRLVRESGGRCVPPRRRAPLAEAIERSYLAWKEGTAAPAARPAWLEEHTRERLAARLARELDALVPTEARR